MADLSTGADSVGGERFGSCEYNDIKNHWRMSDPCTNLANIQPGMIVSDSDDEKLYHYQAAACQEIIQTATPISDDAQIIGGDNSDTILIPYEETTNDAIIWGLPVDPKRGLIFCDVADIAVNFTGLITAHTQPVAWWIDLDNDSYLGVGHQADDRPGIWSGAADTSILALQYEANANITVFENATSGETREFIIHGFRAADANRALEIGVGVDAADTASFDGLSNYFFDGNVGVNIQPTTYLHVSGTGGSVDPVFRIDVSASEAFNWASSALAPNLTNTEKVVHFIGQAENARNSAYMGFRYTGDGLTTNSLIFGLFAVDDLLTITGNRNVGFNQTTFGANALGVMALASGTAPTTSIADCFQEWSMDVLGVAGKAGPHWRSEENGMYAWHGGAGTINSFTYQADVADDGTFNLPAITDSAWGFIQAGDNEEYALFTVDDDGDVTIISNSANVVANADTDTKLCLGTAPAQEGLVIRNRLGAQKNINLIIWYS